MIPVISQPVVDPIEVIATDKKKQHPTPYDRKTHIPALDGIRGVAILLVLVHHMIGAHEKSGWYARKLAGLAEAGWSGVDLFFCLSGFLITGILIESRTGSNPLRTFYMRRTLRIFPLYYLTLFLLFVVVPALGPMSQQYQTFLNYQWWHWAYLPNILILFKIPDSTLLTSHFWSLAVEEQFYMFWPFVVLFTRIETLKRVCLVLFVVAFAFRSICFLMDWGHSPAYVLPISRLDALVGGAFVAIAIRDVDGWPRYKRIARLLFPLAILIFAGVTLFQGSFRRGPLMMTVGFSSISLAFAILIGAAATNSWPIVSRVFEYGFLRFFGKYSYAMYVFHTFIIGWLLSLFPTPGDSGSLLAEGVPRMVVFTVVGILLTAITGVISWIVFESHVMKLKKYFELKRG